MAAQAALAPKKPPKKTKGKAKKKKVVLSASDKAALKIKKEHESAVRSSFTRSGFTRVSGVSGKEFTYENQKTDLDDIFVYENVIILAEYTTSKSSNVGEHLKQKKIVYDKILSSTENFIQFLKVNFPSSAKQLSEKYHVQKLIVKIVYCSRYDFEEKYRTNVPGPVYMDYPAVRYFAAVSDAVRKSARFELFSFLGIDQSKVGTGGKVSVSKPAKSYSGSILPESHSHFDDGFKIVSFYADPEALLQSAYVLRKDGWRDSLNLYQRMISKRKIEAIRAYLKKQKRVFINNVIVTLPSNVKPLDENGDTFDTTALTETAAVTIMLPDAPNTIGLIDGQHRVFAYHETAVDDDEIAKLRVQQNLLVTGVIYPPDLKDIEREKFEARLFLEINSTQTNAKSQLKQAIGLVLEPFAVESIAARVLSRLSKVGPLEGVIEQYFFDTDKLKTSSIVSFGLKPLVKTSGDDSLFSIWVNAAKSDVEKGRNAEALSEYIEFCVETINRVLIAIRKNLASGRWTTDAKTAGRVLATTYVNSFLIVLRLLIEAGKPLDELSLEAGFKGIDSFDFAAYRSSQYKRMASAIVEKHFGIAAAE